MQLPTLIVTALCIVFYLPTTVLGQDNVERALPPAVTLAFPSVRISNFSLLWRIRWISYEWTETAPPNAWLPTVHGTDPALLRHRLSVTRLDWM
ncbi:hypothetical protein B0H13DRAFT_2392308 [Mycena leptocephala]|nr:hypothetical protein B0H13DRAFT_2392308 [Mycena leptocephala]